MIGLEHSKWVFKVRNSFFLSSVNVHQRISFGAGVKLVDVIRVDGHVLNFLPLPNSVMKVASVELLLAFVVPILATRLAFGLIFR